MGQDLLLGT